MPVYEADNYKVEVGKACSDYEGDQYIIVNKVTGVVETESRLFAQAVSYCDQLNDAYFETKLKEAPESDGEFHDFVCKEIDKAIGH